MLNNEIMNIQDLFSSSNILYNSHFVQISFVQLEEDLPTDAKGRISWRSVEARTKKGEAIPALIQQRWSFGKVTLDEVLITKVRRTGTRIFLTVEDKYLGHIGEISTTSFKQAQFVKVLNGLYNEKVNIHNETVKQARKDQFKAEAEEQMAKDKVVELIGKVKVLEMEVEIQKTRADKAEQKTEYDQDVIGDLRDKNEQLKYALQVKDDTMVEIKEKHRDDVLTIIKIGASLLKRVGEGMSPMKATAEFMREVRSMLKNNTEEENINL